MPKLNGDTIRVLVVDDSALMRKILSDIISGAPNMQTVGTARDGEDAVAKTRSLQPDVITLDVEMPGMDGIAFLKVLMRERPTPVLMISSLTTEGADTTLACLEQGAVDFIGKPSGAVSLNLAESGNEIVKKIRAIAKTTAWKQHISTNNEPRVVSKTEQPSLPSCTPAPMSGDTAVVVVASSTGGPAALSAVIPLLPADLNAAYLVIQHLPVGFTRSLADRLDRDSLLTVREAKAGDTLMRGLALIAPSGYHLEFNANRRIVLNTEPTLWGVRPAADVTMGSLANRFGRQVIGVVLTGMGKDGALGVQAIKKAGGECIAQDEETSIIYGMPRCAFETGSVEQLVPLPLMAQTMESRIRARTDVRQ